MEDQRQLRWIASWYFAYFAFLGAFNTYFTLYLVSLGISPGVAAWMLSIQPVMRVLAPNFWGWLADRMAKRAGLVALTTGASAVLMVGLLNSIDPWVLLLLLAAQAIFWSGALPLVESLTLARLQHRVERYGRVRLWGSLGFIVSVQLIGLSLDHMDVSALPVLSLSLMGLAFLVALQLREQSVPVRRTGVGDFLTVLVQRRVLALFTGALFMSIAHAPLYLFYSLHLVVHGYARTWVGFFWAVGVLAEIGVFLFMPTLFRRFSVRQVLCFSHGVAVVRFLLIAWCPDWAGVLLLAQLMHGVTFGAAHAACVGAINRWFSPEMQGRAQSFYSSACFGGGSVLGGLISGYCWDGWGSGICYSLAALFALVGGAILLRFLPSR